MAQLEEKKQMPARFRFLFFLNLKDRKLLLGMMGHCCTQPLSRPCLCTPQGFTEDHAITQRLVRGAPLLPTAISGKRPTCQFLGPDCLSLANLRL